MVIHCAIQAEAGIKFVGVPQPKPLHGFSPNFQGMFTPRGSRADLAFRQQLLPWQHLRFSSLKFMGVPQTKPLYGFSTNFQGMFTPRGSSAN